MNCPFNCNVIMTYTLKSETHYFNAIRIGMDGWMDGWMEGRRGGGGGREEGEGETESNLLSTFSPFLRRTKKSNPNLQRSHFSTTNSTAFK